MEKLKELVEIVSKQAIKRIEVMGNPSNYTSKMRDLYEGIQDGRFDNDASAAAELYGQGEESANYKKLKYRLQQRLINTLFFIDINKPAYNELQRARHSCRKASVAVSILFNENARKSAIALAKNTLNAATKYEFTEIALNLSKILTYHYGTMAGDLKKFEYYNQLSKDYLELLQAEMEAEEYYERLVLYSIKSGSSKKFDLENIAIEYTEKLKQGINKLESYRLNRYTYYVFVLRYQIVHDYENLLRTCQEAIRYFENKLHFQTGAILHFLIWQLNCQIQLEDYEGGVEVAKRCLKMARPGSNNWFTIFDFYTILSLHTQNYTKAYELIYEVIDHPKFRSIPKFAKEHWKLSEAYIQFLIKIGKVEIDDKTEVRRFRLSKFLNEVPTYSAEKRRTNIPILIIQLLFLLQAKRYHLVVDKVETLHAYCYRYLRKDDTFRSNCFIKMLLMLPKAHFHRQAVIRKTDHLKKRLIAVPMEIARQAGEVEIIPYETLWSYILEMLENRFYYQ